MNASGRWFCVLLVVVACFGACSAPAGDPVETSTAPALAVATPAPTEPEKVLPELSPEEARKAIDTGIKLFHQGATKTALRNLEEGLHNLPDDPQGLAYQARALDKLGRSDEASAVYEKILAKDAKNAEIHWRYGNTLLVAGRDQPAEQHFTTAIELGYGATALLSRSAVSMKRKEYEKAIKDLDAAIAAEPELAQAYILRAQAYQKLGKKDKATQDFFKARKLNGRRSPMR
ncbi:MAG: tetratricopeptide repeat protein [Vulcanimicrobiota bacterium]